MTEPADPSPKPSADPPAEVSNVVRLPLRSRAASREIAAGPIPEATATAIATAIAAAIAKGDLVCASALIETARAEGLSLREDMALAASLLPLLASRDVQARDARRAAQTLGWLDANGDLPAGQAFDRLRARLAAERWFDEILAVSSRRDPFDARTAAARRLLGRRPALFRRLVRPSAALRTLAGELAPHREWVEGRLDPAALDEVGRLLSSP